MLGSSILDVAIGMAFIYLLLSLIVSAIQEGIAAVAQARAANLLEGLHSLFSGDIGPDGQPLLESFYDHGLIRGLYRDRVRDSGKKPLRAFDRVRMLVQRIVGFAPGIKVSAVSNRMLLPAYIPSRTFALALIDILTPANEGKNTSLDRLREVIDASVKDHPDNKAMEALSALADSAGNDLRLFQRRLEDWYNDAMDRISGWYKKHTQNILLVVGLVLAIVFNVNSIRVAETLWTNKDAREAMVAGAKQYVTEHQPPQSSASGQETMQDLQARLKEPINQLQQIENENLLPLGWTEHLYRDSDSRSIAARKVSFAIVGWLITALALSLGASFWFDTLNKFMVIRGTIKPQEKSQSEPSKDK